MSGITGEKIWLDGALVDWDDARVHVGAHGLHYGTGVFEGIRAYETADGPGVFRLTEHMARLHQSARIMLMDMPYTVDELVEAIKVVHGGGIYISPKVSDEVLQHLRRPKRERVGLEALSQREFDLLRILGAGKTLQQCAQQMKVSTSTASTYRARVMEKLNLESTAELIRFALEHNVVG